LKVFTDEVVGRARMEFVRVRYGLERFEENGKALALMRVAAVEDRSGSALWMNDAILVLSAIHLNRRHNKNAHYNHICSYRVWLNDLI